jgi:hypothetical protein
MVFFPNFYRWKLGRQLLVTFLGSSMILVVILIILTRLQLDWLKTEMINKTDELLKDYTQRTIYINAR